MNIYIYIYIYIYRSGSLRRSNCLHFSSCESHPRAGAMLIFPVWLQFYGISGVVACDGQDLLSVHVFVYDYVYVVMMIVVIARSLRLMCLCAYLLACFLIYVVFSRDGQDRAAATLQTDSCQTKTL